LHLTFNGKIDRKYDCLWLPLAWGIDIHVFPEAWR